MSNGGFDGIHDKLLAALREPDVVIERVSRLGDAHSASSSPATSRLTGEPGSPRDCGELQGSTRPAFAT